MIRVDLTVIQVHSHLAEVDLYNEGRPLFVARGCSDVPDYSAVGKRQYFIAWATSASNIPSSGQPLAGVDEPPGQYYSLSDGIGCFISQSQRPCSILSFQLRKGGRRFTATSAVRLTELVTTAGCIVSAALGAALARDASRKISHVCFLCALANKQMELGTLMPRERAGGWGRQLVPRIPLTVTIQQSHSGKA